MRQSPPVRTRSPSRIPTVPCPSLPLQPPLLSILQSAVVPLPRELVIRPASAAGPGFTPIHHQTGLSTVEPFDSNARPLGWLRDRLSTLVALDKAALCRSSSQPASCHVEGILAAVESPTLVAEIAPMDTPSQFFNEAAYDDPSRDGYFDTENIPGLKTEPGVDDTTIFLNQPNEVLLAAQLLASKSSAQKAASNIEGDPAQPKLETDTMNLRNRRSQRHTRGSTATVDSQASSTQRSTPPALVQASSRSTDPSAEPPPALPKKQQKRKKSSASSVPSTKDDPKRDVFLQRNRVAASKCRQKKKELKDQLMSHAPCNDRNIDLWLEAEARRFAQNSSKRFNPAHGATLPSEQQLPPGAMTLPPSHLAVPSTDLSMSSMPMDPNLAAVTSGAVGGGQINYDHMPDSIFEDTS
ncbi:hypothetical protein HYQ44_011541 [Verticillium longisporum]|nr:hypothetical protein HYQ44_011541 [Verticillium longisporum]